MMQMEDNFNEFISNLQIDNFDDINTSLEGIAKKLNQKYYDNSTTENYLIVGSMGRNTSIKGESDIDVIYELPDEVFERFDDYESNGQSQLLNEIRDTLKEKYPSTDIKGDGQVVVISFTKYKIELVPGFKQGNNSYKYPDTHDGGSWKNTKPIPEIEEANNMINNTSTYRDICQMIREWKANNGVTICGLLIDTLVKNFLDDNSEYKWKSKDDYYILLKSVFKFLSEQDEDRKQWNAMGSNQIIENKNFNFIKKSKKAYNKLSNSTDESSTLRELFGSRFPISEQSANEYGHSYEEQFIEEIYPVYIMYSLKIDCEITQNGFRTGLLSEFMKKKFMIKQNRKLKFMIVENDIPKPYEIYWKVRNVGYEAIRRNCIRGQIKKGMEYLSESTNFYGPHYVECYIIKDGICVARDKISVNIDYD